ncbi:hypothetical protein [Microbacterium cremeum]|uniref:hypothetical protein n=1 Tax=Microbacterium cremeum TaxID=2782169 RepID=UPI001888E2C1|nr:hypothetical protein [Microbacterium cremeum]
MTLDAAALLAGPRGRRLCLEYARAAASRAGSRSAQDAATAVGWAQYALEEGAVAVLVMRSDPDPFTPPRVSPEEAAAALTGISIDTPAWPTLREALAVSVDTARYWQEPDGADALAATPAFRTALRRVAEVIVAAPDTRWWESPLDLHDQWAVAWEGAGRLSADPAGELAAWRVSVADDDARAGVERPADPTAPWSGWWWSIPPHALPRTSRRLGDDGPAGLWFVEDFHGGDEATAVPVDAYPARVIEIGTPEDWADLCRRHPIDVTASRRHDWYRVTGRDGRWVVPDWSSVAREADGVHLSVAGYLTAATRLIEIDHETGSVIAGWNPDETFWFRGVSARPADQERWRRDRDVWRRVGA